MLFWIFIFFLALATNFIYRNFVLPTIQLKRKKPNDKAKYELRKLKAPIMTGKLLTLMMHITEIPIIGDLLIYKLMKDSGLNKLWEIDVDDYPGTLQCVAIPDKRNKKNKETKLDSEKIDQDKFFKENSSKGFQPQTIDTYIDAYNKKSTDPVKVVKQIIEKAKLLQQEYKMNSIAQINEQDALKQAEISKKFLEEGNPRSKFEGVPIMVKEELSMKGYKFSVGTKFLSSDENSEDCAVVERLKKSGFIVVGLASMFEIGISPTGLNVNRGPCKNPYDLTRDTGGSSSGSCSVVASGLVPCSIGCDGGGSIRVPASHCGLVGLKATHSRIPEKGVYPLCFSVGHAGPIAWTVKDVFSIYQVIAGEDEEEIYSLYQPKPDPVLYPNYDILQSNAPLQNIRIGVYNEWVKDCDSQVYKAFQNGLNVLKKYGGKIVDIEIPLLEELRLAHFITITSEMNSVMIPKDQFRHLHGENVRLPLNITRKFSASEYVQAQKIRTCCSLIHKKIFENVDVIVTPTCGIVAPQYPKDCSTGEVNSETLSSVMRYVFPGNTLGFPAITVPVGYNSDKMPIGFQIISNLWDENTSIFVSTFIEKEFERISPKVYTNII